MVGKISLLLSITISTLFALDIQIVGVDDGNNILAGQSIQFNASQNGEVIDLDSINFSYYPTWAANLSQNNLTVNSNYLGYLSLVWNYGEKEIQKKIQVDNKVNRSNTQVKIEIDSAVFISLNTSLIRQSDTLSLIQNPLTLNAKNSPDSYYELLFKNISLDSFSLSNESSKSRSIWSIDSLQEWVLLKDLNRSQSITLGMDQVFALVNSTSNSKSQFEVFPQSFSPYFSQRGQEPGTNFVFKNEELQSTLLVEINIYNSDGILVRRLYRGYKNKFLGQNLTWFYDGLDDKGRALRNGRYRVLFTYEVEGKEHQLQKDFGVFK